jgi:hypothetical protein
VCDVGTCIKTLNTGAPDASGTFTTRCQGPYPDFVAELPTSAEYSGPTFTLSQAWPSTLQQGKTPWTKFDFKKPAEAEAYANAVLEHAFEGMIDAGWRPELNKVSAWYHVPWMTTGRHPREFISGLTDERSVRGPELGLKNGVSINNYAVGVYNDIAGVTLQRVWGQVPPDETKSQFDEGSAVVKVLVTDAQASDFSGADILKGAPTLVGWTTNRATGKKQAQALRVLQIDFATRDSRAGKGKWVFGTFAYDAAAPGNDPWRRMKVVGLMWGNDPTVKPGGAAPVEGWVNPNAPQYARDHLGWAGRVNGPVDNPVSACLSCHQTAQFPGVAPLVPVSTCTDDQKLIWFRNLAGTEAFGSVANCKWSAPKPSDKALDFSLQNMVALGNANSSAQKNACEVVPFVAVASFDGSPTAKIKRVTPKKRPADKRPVYEVDR